MAGQSVDLVGTAGVDVVPVVTDFHTKLKAKILPGATTTGSELGRLIANAMAAKIADAIPKAVASGAAKATADAVRQGSRTGGAFADSLRAKLEAAFRAMPKLDIKLSDVGADAELARLRAKLEDLRNKRIGIDVSAADADAKIREIDEKLAVLGARSPNVAVKVDVATARAAIAEIRAEIAEASRSDLEIRVRVGQFRESLLAQVEAAQASLPAIQIDADTTPARQELDRYRAELAAIPVRVRTDAAFGDAEALAEVDRLQAKLAELSRNRRVDVDVRADAARAEAELAVVRAEVDALDSKRVRINVDTSGADGAILALALNIAALAAIPAIPILGAGVGGLAAAFTAAGAGAGAFALAALPAIHGVTAAMQAQTQAANSSTKASTAQANAGVTAAQQALQMAGAQQALASAQRQAAQSITSADEQVKKAAQSVADAEQNAADQRIQALRGVKDAEQTLADAQRSEKDAQASLTQARKDAAQQLRDLDNQLADSKLNSREAALRVARTKAELQAAQSNPNTSALDLADAQLAYDQAVQGQKEQAQQQKALTSSAAAQRKAGVDGNDAVKRAAEQLATAQEDVAKKTQAVADAQANVIKTAKASARAIADAQRQEADAVRNAANVRAQAADSIASAERGIEQARLSASKVTGTAATKEDAYQKALAKLSPEARKLFDALAGPRGLKTAFSDWSKSMQPEVIPLLIRGVNALKGTLPGLTPLVHAASDGIGVLFDKSSAQLKNPFWRGFKADINSSAKPAIIGLGVAFGNVFKGLAGIIDAFLPHMAGIASTMDRITGRFANFGTRLKGSPAFEHFLDYVKTNGPKVAEFIGNILSAALQVSKALSPVSIAVMGVLNPVLNAVGWLATNMPGLVQFFYSAYLFSKLWGLSMTALSVATGLYATIQALATLETWSWSAALQTTGIPELIIAIVVVVAALTAGIIWAFKNVGWFHTAVVGAWTGIKAASLFLWHDVLKPTFDGIVIAVKAVGAAAVWLWQSAIGPSFRFIWEAGKILATIIGVFVFTPIYIAVKLMGAVFGWLWKAAIKPAFDGIAIAAVWLWKTILKPTFGFIGDLAVWLWNFGIKPTFAAIKLDFTAIGDAATFLWKHAIKPAFGGIADVASWLWSHGLKSTFDVIKSGVGKVGDAFGLARDAIKIAWNQLKDIASTPVKFIVDHVYNEGIRPVWNGVAKVTGVKTLDKVDTSKWATGGVLPGYTPGRDPHKFYSPTGGRLELSGGESIMRPEFTAAVGSGFVDFFNRLAATQGVAGVRRGLGSLGGARAFSGGGIIGSIGGLIGSGTSKAVGLATDLGEILKNPSKVWDALGSKISGALSHLTNSDWQKMLAKFPLAVIKGLKTKTLDLVQGLLGQNDSGPGKLIGGGGGAKWATQILQALSMVGQPASYLGITQRRMMQESGGNPTAVNLWDSNAQAGHPSVGLMQLIQGTFREYAGPFLNTGPFAYGVSENPLAQFYSSMKYALSRYGSLPAAYNRAGGYDEGGWLMPGDHKVYNHTGRPEPVFTAGQWATLKANIDSRNAPSTTSLSARVFIGDREITDIVRTEVTLVADDAAAALSAGRR